MTDGEFKHWIGGILEGLHLSRDKQQYFPRDHERELVATLDVIARLRDGKNLLYCLNSQLVLNAVCFTDAATITDAGVKPPELENVFRLAVEGKLWAGN